jgi:hypothetical protein
MKLLPVQQTLGSLLDQLDAMQNALSRHETELRSLTEEIKRKSHDKPPVEFQFSDPV